MGWKYNLLDHTADIAADIHADSLNELFVASAMFWRESISDDRREYTTELRSIDLSENNLEILLVSFLSELNFLFQSKGWLMDSISIIEIVPHRDLWELNTQFSGHFFDRKKMNLKSEIKAVTYHQMEVKEENGKFYTRIIFDI